MWLVNFIKKMIKAIASWFVYTKITSEVLLLVDGSARIGTKLGLSRWAEYEPEKVKEIAGLLGDNVFNVLIPWIRENAAVKSAVEVSEFLASNLFKDLPIAIKGSILVVFELVDSYMPIPNPDTFLNSGQIKLILAFLDGVDEGCDEFLHPEVTKSCKSRFNLG